MFCHYRLIVAMLVVTLSVGPTGPAASAEVAAVPAAGNRLTESWENWLRTSDSMVLISIDPLALRDYSDAKREALQRGERPDQLGRLVLTDPAERLLVGEALIADIAAAEQLNMMCFNPRLEVQATKDGKVLTLVICYQCGNVRVHGGEKDGIMLNLSGSSAPILKQMLTKAGISLAK